MQDKIRLYISLLVGISFFFITLFSDVGDQQFMVRVFTSVVGGVIGFGLVYIIWGKVTS